MSDLKRIDELAFTHAFAALPPAFYTKLMPTPLPEPYLVAGSAAAAHLIGLDPAEFARAEFVAAMTGNRVPGNAQPLSAVYSGHQFGVWAGQLGDGRAILLGEVPSSAGTLEIQLKGAGLTPYSRSADGRAVLRSSIREFLCSEAMAGLGVPTSRALCVTGSAYPVFRESAETAAVCTRMAPSFVRFGSFEHWFYADRMDELKLLADHVIDGFYPQLRAEANPYQALLAEVCRRTARMIAQWQAVGFMHGVMNTDNMSILGITIDYGPFGFMEAFDVNHICNHSDHAGRYSYRMQPEIGRWNCYALGQAMLPLIGTVDDTHAALHEYGNAFTEAYDAALHAKLGLLENLPEDRKLIDALFVLLQQNHVDYTNFFRALCDLKLGDPSADTPLRDLVIDRAAFDTWAALYRERLAKENSVDAERAQGMRAVNPKYVLRNYLAQTAIEKAAQGDMSEVARLLSVLERPYDEQPENAAYAALPPDWANTLQVSCSS